MEDGKENKSKRMENVGKRRGGVGRRSEAGSLLGSCALKEHIQKENWTLTDDILQE